MKSRAEITSRFAKAFVKAGKKDKGTLLDEVASVTGWSRDNARRRLAAAARPPGSGTQVAKRRRKPRSGKFSYDAVKVLQRVWAASGGQCGKYRALSMSAASMDRYLAPAKAGDQIRGVSTTKASPLLRSSITIRRAGDESDVTRGWSGG